MTMVLEGIVVWRNAKSKIKKDVLKSTAGETDLERYRTFIDP